MMRTHTLSRRRSTGGLAAVLAGVLVLGVGGYAFAQDDSDDPAGEEATAVDTPGSESEGAGPGERRERLRERRADRPRPIHADLLVPEGDDFVTVTVDRGTLEGEVGDSVTVVRPDGESVTKSVTDETRIRGEDPGALEPGQPTLVVSKGDQATVVAQRPESGGN